MSKRKPRAPKPVRAWAIVWKEGDTEPNAGWVHWTRSAAWERFDSVWTFPKRMRRKAKAIRVLIVPEESDD